MKRLILIVMSTLLMAASPAPVGHVNDFANIIPNDREAALEQSLRGYEEQTTIEVAIVTTPSLDGKAIEDYSIALAREWGVGKGGADNGVLIVIAPNDREYRVEVGYGLEGDLTDADADTIARNTLVSAFRAGDYPSGIENLTQALTEHLGTTTPEQRAAIHRKMEEAEAREADVRKAAFFSFMGWVLGFVILAIILYIAWSLLKRYQTWVRNNQRREELLKYVEDTDSVPDTLMEEMQAINLPNLPVWMQDDKERLSLDLEKALEKAGHIRGEMQGLIAADLDQAESFKAGVVAAIAEAEAILEALRSIPEQVRLFRDECEQVVVTVAGEIDDLMRQVALLTGKNYRVKDLVPALDVARLAEEKESINSLLSNRGEGLRDASESVHGKATKLQMKVRSLKQQLDSAIQTQSYSEHRIEALKGRVATFTTLFQEHRSRVERLQVLAPRPRWISLVEGMPVFERALTGIAPRVDAAIRANSMELQLFANAAEMLDAAEASLRSVDTTVNQAKDLESAVTQAKQHYATKLNTANEAVSKAKSLMEDDDVGPAAKSRLQEAEKLLKSVNVGSTSTDWITAQEALTQATAKANQAAQLAQADIDSAERERQRERDEEARRKRRAQQANASSSSRSRSGGSFGGFGGGGFGGGGASGKW